MIRKILDYIAMSTVVISLIAIPLSMFHTLNQPTSAEQITEVKSASTVSVLADTTKTPTTTLELVNQYRSEHGIAAMVEDPVLTEMANRRADDMVARQYFAHENPDGKIFYQLMSEEGTEPNAACENLALSYGSDIGAPFRGWKDSPGHNACMLDDRMTRAGYAFRIYGTSYDAGNQPRTHYLVVAIHGSN